jgi:hypothetical protein
MKYCFTPLSIRIESGDGNCLFRSVCTQLFGDPDKHATLRRLACEFILRDWDFYHDLYHTYIREEIDETYWDAHANNKFARMCDGVLAGSTILSSESVLTNLFGATVDDTNNYKDRSATTPLGKYVLNMARNGCWGGHFELNIICRMLPSITKAIIFSIKADEVRIAEIIPDGSSKAAPLVTSDVKNFLKGAHAVSTLVLEHCNGIHYNTILDSKGNVLLGNSWERGPFSIMLQNSDSDSDSSNNNSSDDEGDDFNNNSSDDEGDDFNNNSSDDEGDDFNNNSSDDEGDALQEDENTDKVDKVAFWEEFVDASLGMPYYRNTTTLEVVWDRPLVTDVTEANSDSEGDFNNNSSDDEGENNKVAFWEEFVDVSSGKPYYRNSITKEVVWDLLSVTDAKDEMTPDREILAQILREHQFR